MPDESATWTSSAAPPRAVEPDAPIQIETGTRELAMTEASSFRRASSTAAPGLSICSTTATTSSVLFAAPTLRMMKSASTSSMMPSTATTSTQPSGHVCCAPAGAASAPDSAVTVAATSRAMAVSRNRLGSVRTAGPPKGTAWILSSSSLHPEWSSSPGKAGSAKPPSPLRSPWRPREVGLRTPHHRGRGQGRHARRCSAPSARYDESDLAARPRGRPRRRVRPDAHPGRGAPGVPARTPGWAGSPTGW